MLNTTTNNIDGKEIKEYLGVVTGEAISGANFIKDLMASLRDFTGGRSGAYEQELSKARNIAFDEMNQKAMEMGANIYGSVADVFINADGFKKSIPGPGIGNYITVGKAMGTIKSMLGDQALQQNTYMQAHGTGTPQNRVTESHIFNELAKVYGLSKWPITAIKAYIGHSLACASGDQIASSLGVWQDGIIPGINTTPSLAEDVHSSHLNFLLEHTEIDPTTMAATLINSKGFGGNNATAAILSPTVTKSMLQKRFLLMKLLKYAEMKMKPKRQRK